jgi:hypothetical protein
MFAVDLYPSIDRGLSDRAVWDRDGSSFCKAFHV